LIGEMKRHNLAEMAPSVLRNFCVATPIFVRAWNAISHSLLLPTLLSGLDKAGQLHFPLGVSR
jgi:hypothetical protein